jgi:hypothetical protein
VSCFGAGVKPPGTACSALGDDAAGHVRMHVATEEVCAGLDGGRVVGKLEARDGAQVVVFAYESGLVRAGARPGSGARAER